MKRNWVYDDTIKRALAFSRKHRLDLGTDVVSVPLTHVHSEHSVIVVSSMVEAIREAVAHGESWPEIMPLPVLACEPGRCITLDGNHRIKAARAAGLLEIPAIVVRLSTWETMLPVMEQKDIIPFDDFFAVLAEAGDRNVRMNLDLEAKAREEFP